MIKLLIACGIEERTCLIEQGTSLESKDGQLIDTSGLVSCSIIAQGRVIYRQLISNSITLAYDKIHHFLGWSTWKGICLILTQNLGSERNITKLLYCSEVEVSTEITSLILQALETGHLGSIVLIELVVREITLILVSQEIVGCTDGRIVVAPVVLGIQCTPGTIGKILYATVLPGIFSLITGRSKHSLAVWSETILQLTIDVGNEAYCIIKIGKYIVLIVIGILMIVHLITARCEQCQANHATKYILYFHCRILLMLMIRNQVRDREIQNGLPDRLHHSTLDPTP